MLEPNVLSHIVLLYLYQNSLEGFYERLKTSIISMLLRREMEENQKMQQVTIGFLFLISETVLLSTRAVCEMVQAVLQHFYFFNLRWLKLPCAVKEHCVLSLHITL